MKTTKISIFLLFIVGNSFLAQSNWSFNPRGIEFYGDILSFTNASHYSSSDPKTGNFSFGAEYYIQLYSDRFYLSPGINLSYMEIIGIPEEGTDYSKSIATVSLESEILLPIIYPIAFNWKFGSIFSLFGNAGISFAGKYFLASEKLGSVLDGNKINLYAVNAGFKIKFIPNLSGYISLKYYFSNSYNFQDYFANYNVSGSKIKLYNIGVGFSYNLFNETINKKRIEQSYGQIDSLNYIITQKNLALEEMKISLDSSKNELKKIKGTSSINDSLEERNNYAIIKIDSLNLEYNAKFYEDLSINDFLARNNLYLSDEGKALLEGYHDVANKIELNQRKGIFLILFVPEVHQQIFQNYIDEMNWGNILSIRINNNSKYIRFEIDSEKIKKNYNIDLEINF